MAEIGFHADTDSIFRAPLPKQEVQRRGWQSAFLWKDESYQLYKPVYNRSGHLFSVRSLSCSLLRICGEFVDWSFHVPAASMVLQMVAVQV